HSDLPYSSRNLEDCYRCGAEIFRWEGRPTKPRTLKDGRLLVGWGMATATYPGHIAPASARAKLFQDGRAVVQSSTQDLGTGTYTIMTQVASDALGVPLRKVRFELGDSAFPKAPVSGGSMTAASVGSAIWALGQKLTRKLATLASNDAGSSLHARPPEALLVK